MRGDFDFLAPFLPKWAGRAAAALLLVLIIFVIAMRTTHGHSG